MTTHSHSQRIPSAVVVNDDLRPHLALAWMKHGAAAFPQKPFQPDYLIELCARARRERALPRAQDRLSVTLPDSSFANFSRAVVSLNEKIGLLFPPFRGNGSLPGNRHAFGESVTCSRFESVPALTAASPSPKIILQTQIKSALLPGGSQTCRYPAITAEYWSSRQVRSLVTGETPVASNATDTGAILRARLGVEREMSCR